MKILPLILLLILSFIGFSQEEPSFCQSLLEKAEQSLKSKEYEKAIKYCESGIKHCEESTNKFRGIIQNTYLEIENEKNTVVTLNLKNEKLINAFYFYEDKLALAYKDLGIVKGKRFGFINKEGDEVIGFKYYKANQFQDDGFARVKKIEWNNNYQKNIKNYLIDITGNEYEVAFFIDSLAHEKIALDLTEDRFSEKYFKIIDFKRLEILLLNREYYYFVITDDFGDYLGDEYNQPVMGDEAFSVKEEETRNIYSFLRIIDSLPSLEVLSIANFRIDTLSYEIGNLKYLKHLNADNNSLKDLPRTFNKLNSLEFLSLKNNRFKILPLSICQLSNLKYLYLANNELKNFPKEIGNLKRLEVLDLNYNNINSLPHELSKLQNLKVLRLWGNNLSSDEQLKLKELLPNCKIYF